MLIKEFEKNLQDLFIRVNTIKNEFMQKINILENLDDNLIEKKQLKIKIEIADSRGFSNEVLYLNFKLPINFENLFKSAINSIITKINNYYKTFDKKQFLENFKLKNQSYFEPNLLYATNYGIGYFCLFLTQSRFESINNKISSYLESLKIGFKNEFSDAFWVYRFKINGFDKTSNIQILKNLNNSTQF